VDSTGSASSTVQSSAPSETQETQGLDRYLWGAAFVVMIVWLLIKLFGKSLIRMK
jgi:hypothetical protein